MYNIAKASEQDRRVLFRNTAQQTGLHEAIIEKDFWVCLTLDHLFHHSPWKAAFTFKGGTSLSKCYGLIQRFSEDIDLILDWRVLGYGLHEPWAPRSNTKQDQFNKEANERAEQFLRDRFGVLLKLELYGPDELARIIMRSAGILDQPITPEGAYELAKCSRGTPRVANRFLKRIRDFATVLGDGVIDRDVALMGLKRMDVDALGLDELDRSVLRAIIEMYNGGPVGLETLAAALGEEAVTLEDLCEPYLMQMGFLTRTPRGRCVTRLAYEHLGMKAPESGAPEDNGQQSLF